MFFLLNSQTKWLVVRSPHIKGPEIEDQDIALALGLLVETIDDSSSGWPVDDTKDIESHNKAGIIGDLELGVVEVGGDGVGM